MCVRACMRPVRVRVCVCMWYYTHTQCTKYVIIIIIIISHSSACDPSHRALRSWTETCVLTACRHIWRCRWDTFSESLPAVRRTILITQLVVLCCNNVSVWNPTAIQLELLQASETREAKAAREIAMRTIRTSKSDFLHTALCQEDRSVFDVWQNV